MRLVAQRASYVASCAIHVPTICISSRHQSSPTTIKSCCLRTTPTPYPKSFEFPKYQSNFAKGMLGKADSNHDTLKSSKLTPSLESHGTYTLRTYLAKTAGIRLISTSTSTQGLAKASSINEISTKTNEARPLVSLDNNSIMPRRFRSLQAIHLKPLKRRPRYGIPSCDLQLRSYSVRNLEFFTDFAVRAAYYLGLCVSGPIPLPRIIERWTVPRSHFIDKKSQENFERITMRRLLQIHDGHPESIELWLAYLRKNQYYAVGMKANIWDVEQLHGI